MKGENYEDQLSGDADSPDRILTARWSGSGWDAPQVAAGAIPAFWAASMKPAESIRNL